MRARISFCTTCKNRFWQLYQTLPVNLEAIRADGNSELVLVNYNSQDELDKWVRAYVKPVIKLGIVRYIHEQTEPYFHCSKAKNIAHFAARGRFVVNLDADNFIGETIPVWRGIWAENRDTIIQGFCGDFADGTYGRIGLSKARFLALGGYDEEMLPFAHQDRDLISRAKAFGLRSIRIKQEGVPAVKNNYLEKMRYAGTKYNWPQMSRINSKRLEENIREGRLVANPHRKPVKVVMNFTEEIEL